MICTYKNERTFKFNEYVHCTIVSGLLMFMYSALPQITQFAPKIQDTEFLKLKVSETKSTIQGCRKKA